VLYTRCLLQESILGHIATMRDDPTVENFLVCSQRYIEDHLKPERLATLTVQNVSHIHKLLDPCYMTPSKLAQNIVQAVSVISRYLSTGSKSHIHIRITQGMCPYHPQSASTCT
jgi:hypothetical protein